MNVLEYSVPQNLKITISGYSSVIGEGEILINK